MKREDYEKELEKERGKEYLVQNKGLLDAQWEYIESLGQPEDIINPDQDCEGLILSHPHA